MTILNKKHRQYSSFFLKRIDYIDYICKTDCWCLKCNPTRDSNQKKMSVKIQTVITTPVGNVQVADITHRLRACVIALRDVKDERG